MDPSSRRPLMPRADRRVHRRQTVMRLSVVVLSAAAMWTSRHGGGRHAGDGRPGRVSPSSRTALGAHSDATSGFEAASALPLAPDSFRLTYPLAQPTPVEATLRRMLRPLEATPRGRACRTSAPLASGGDSASSLLIGIEEGRCTVDTTAITLP